MIWILINVIYWCMVIGLIAELIPMLAWVILIGIVYFAVRDLLNKRT